MSLKQMQALERGMTPEYEKWTEWVCKCGNSYKHRCSSGSQRTWVGLTLSDKEEFLAKDFGGNRLDAMDWAEQRLKEKNT